MATNEKMESTDNHVKQSVDAWLLEWPEKTFTAQLTNMDHFKYNQAYIEGCHIPNRTNYVHIIGTTDLETGIRLKADLHLEKLK